MLLINISPAALSSVAVAMSMFCNCPACDFLQVLIYLPMDNL